MLRHSWHILVSVYLDGSNSPVPVAFLVDVIGPSKAFIPIPSLHEPPLSSPFFSPAPFREGLMGRYPLCS